jgi:UDP-N-acetylmuramoylalanine--D-glutamate ligase
MALRFRDRKDPIRALLANGSPVLVVGMGASGIAAAELLASAGCPVVLNDRAAEPTPAAARLHPGIRLSLGAHPPALFRKFPLVVLSPGVPVETPAVQCALRAGVRVIGEMELAFRLSRLPWVAVTGSNGKSTTTTLIGLMAEKGGVAVRTGGNLGTPAVDLVREEEGASFIVAEVSSFQLETMETFRPAVGLLLNISPDHLDRYRGEADYVRAKSLIYARAADRDEAVFNLDDAPAARIGGLTDCGRLPFTRRTRPERGVFVGGGHAMVRDGGRETRLFPLARLRLPGTHNLENALAACAAAHLMGVAPAAMEETLAAFPGLPHRMELVGEYRGIPVYNDSKGTNVGATAKSLEGMAGPIVLIAGGKDKGAPYSPLAPLVKQKVRMLVLLGEAAPRIAMELRGLTETRRASDLAEAVELALAGAHPGDRVVFSPACSSFDMFRNFEERGNLFAAAVRARMEEAP